MTQRFADPDSIACKKAFQTTLDGLQAARTETQPGRYDSSDPAKKAQLKELLAVNTLVQRIEAITSGESSDWSLLRDTVSNRLKQHAPLERTGSRTDDATFGAAKILGCLLAINEFRARDGNSTFDVDAIVAKITPLILEKNGLQIDDIELGPDWYKRAELLLQTTGAISSAFSERMKSDPNYPALIERVSEWLQAGDDAVQQHSKVATALEAAYGDLQSRSNANATMVANYAQHLLAFTPAGPGLAP